MNLLLAIGFLLQANALASGTIVSLSDSNINISESPFWVDSWILTQPQGISVQSVTNFDSAILLTFSGAEFAYLNGAHANSFTGGPSVNWKYKDEKVEYTRTTTQHEDWIDVDVHVKFFKDPPAKAYLSLVSKNLPKDPEERDREILYYSDSVHRTPLRKFETSEITVPVKWIAASSRYFVFPIIPEKAPIRVLMQETAEHQGQASMEFPIVNGEFNQKFKIAFTPKSLDRLRKIDPTLDSTVNLGFFTFVAYPLLWMLKIIYKYVHNYGVAIILLTILIKIILFPLVVKGVRGMRKMAEIQPKIKALQDKHKHDKETLNKEMMNFMKVHKYNPLSGCLPLVLQMPVFFALYSVLYNAVELYRAPFGLWIHDLSARDPYYITPVLLAVLMFLQQKLTPTSAAMDPAQQKVMQFMPVIFGVFMISTPAGLCLYMLVNTVFSVGQQTYLNKKYGLTNVSAAATSF